jgi:hypothetical protein
MEWLKSRLRSHEASDGMATGLTGWLRKTPACRKASRPPRFQTLRSWAKGDSNDIDAKFHANVDANWWKLDHQIIIRSSFESVGICSHSCRNSLEFIRQTSSNIIEVLAERPWQHSVASRAFEPPWRATCWIGIQRSQNPNVSAAFQSAATAASVKMAFKIAELIRDKGKKCKKAQSKKKMTSIDINWHQLTSIDINWHQLTSIDINWRHDNTALRRAEFRACNWRFMIKWSAQRSPPLAHGSRAVEICWNLWHSTFFSKIHSSYWDFAAIATPFLQANVAWIVLDILHIPHHFWCLHQIHLKHT